jgi:hypothetical protein
MIPKRLTDISDDELLDLACEEEFLAGCSDLELDLIWRLEDARNVSHQARSDNERLVEAIWGMVTGARVEQQQVDDRLRRRFASLCWREPD